MRKNVQGGRYRSADTSPELPNGVRTEAARLPRLTGFRNPNGQFLECRGNIVSWLPFPQRGPSGEQQMELATADKTHVSDTDACVLSRRGWFPRGCKIPNIQKLSTTIGKTICYHSASP